MGERVRWNPRSSACSGTSGFPSREETVLGVTEEKNKQQIPGSDSPAPDPGKDLAGDKASPPKPVVPDTVEPVASPPAGEGDAKPAVPKPPPKKVVPKKPKGPQPEPWSSPLVDAIKEEFPDQVLDSYTFVSQRQVVVKKDRVTEILAFLRRNDVEAFDFLSDETAVHWPAEEEFEMVYMLYSFETHGRIRVKARIKEWEQIESLVSLWPGANWLEREIYDMFGIRFANHPNLARILMPEDWTGFPLRKDYDLRLQDVEWVRKHLGIDSGQKFYVGEARHEET